MRQTAPHTQEFQVSPSRFEDHHTELASIAHRGAKPASSPDSRTEALRTLFAKLFPPQLQTALAQARRIILSPDDFLWDLPFAALITNATGPPEYLGLQKPLSYAQSLTLALPSLPTGAAGTGVLIVGNPVYDLDRRAALIAKATSKQSARPVVPASGAKPPASVASLRRNAELRALTRDGNAPPQLPDAQKEAEQVAREYKTKAHTGVEPTEAWFRQRVGQANVIHLATHGLYNPDAPQSSGVLLAVPEKMPALGRFDNDGTLQAWEVWSLKLNADLVVLSACETGRGKKVTGEGLIGLTRAWQYAGARTIVSSLWKVSDSGTAALMTAFHKRLRAGDEKDSALMHAMKLVAGSGTGDWSDPHHWAAFVLVGDTGKMR